MKQMKIFYIMAGFLVGIIYVSACGDASRTLAEAVTNAIDIVFDNSNSGLAAKNPQEAIDEIDSRIDTLESAEIPSLVVGTWEGNERDEDLEDLNYNSEVSITFNSDNTYSCTHFGSLSSFTSNVCSSPLSWSVEGRILKISYTVPDGFIASGYIYLPIHYASSTKMSLLNGFFDAGARVILLTKS